MIPLHESKSKSLKPVVLLFGSRKTNVENR